MLQARKMAPSPKIGVVLQSITNWFLIPFSGVMQTGPEKFAHFSPESVKSTWQSIIVPAPFPICFLLNSLCKMFRSDRVA